MNKKGEVATLLTLGLVLIGGLMTLGLSFLSNNQKIAINSRAANSPISCTTVKPTYTKGNYYSCNGKFYKLSTCVNEIIEGVGNYCKVLNPTTPVSEVVPDSNLGGTLSACYFTSSSEAKSNCDPVGFTSTGCKAGTYKCKTGSAPPVQQSGGQAYNCSEHGGGTAYQGVGCYNLCAGKGSSYIPNSQGPGTDGKNYCCCGGGLPGVDGYPADDSCWIIKCIGGQSTKVQYSDSLSKYDMPLSSCQGGSPYSGGGVMAIGSVDAEKQLATLSCDSGNNETFAPPEEVEEEVQETPPNANCRDFGTATGCNTQCTAFEGSEYTCEAGTDSTIKKWCCPTSNQQTNCKQKTANCSQAQGGKQFTYYQSISTNCGNGNSPVPDDSKKCFGNGINSCTSSTWSEIASLKCGAVTTNSCIAKSCKTLDTRYENKNFHEMNGKFYEDAPCLENKRITDANSLALFCAKQSPGLDFGGALDNACVQKTGNPLAYCNSASVGPAIAPFKNLPCKSGYQYSGDTCNNYGMKCCIPVPAAQSCVKKNCHDINSNYAVSKGVYEKNSAYYTNLNDCSNGSNAIGDIVMYCSQGIGIQASADNSCKQDTGDPLAYCNNVAPFGLNTIYTRNLPCKSGFQHASARCGFPSTVCCVQKRQQTEAETTVECASISYDSSGNIICEQ